jgi:hypothetical protein
MYLVRSIQEREESDFVDQLGADSDVILPLPVVPRRPFDRVAVIHGDRVLGYELDHVERVNENVPVGSRRTPVVKARSLIHVKQKPPRRGRARMAGFQGIRYVARWSDVAL